MRDTHFVGNHDENNIKDMVDIPEEIKDSARRGKLVFFVGAGVSRIAGLPGWSEWSDNILEQLREKEGINYADLEQLKLLKPQQKLSLARIIEKESNIALDWKDSFELKTKRPNCIYDFINKIGCSCITTNYDCLLNPVNKYGVKNGDKNEIKNTSPLCRRIYETSGLHISELDRSGTVIHLHGCIENVRGMIVTTSDYIEHYKDQNLIEFLKKLFKLYTVVFVGYGLEELEILEYLLKKGTLKDKINQHFLLEGFFSHQKLFVNYLAQYYKNTFNIKLLSFKRDKNNFVQLKNILEKWSEDIQVNPPALVDDIKLIDEVLNNE